MTVTEVGTQTQGPQSVSGTFLYCPGEGWDRSGGAFGELRLQGPGQKQWKEAVTERRRILGASDSEQIKEN